MLTIKKVNISPAGIPSMDCQKCINRSWCWGSLCWVGGCQVGILFKACYKFQKRKRGNLLLDIDLSITCFKVYISVILGISQLSCNVEECSCHMTLSWSWFFSFNCFELQLPLYSISAAPIHRWYPAMYANLKLFWLWPFSFILCTGRSKFSWCYTTGYKGCFQHDPRCKRS